jgi:phosphoadenosine phosphosulfate reductase
VPQKLIDLINFVGFGGAMPTGTTLLPSPRARTLAPDAVELAAARLESAAASDVIAWAIDTFGARICLSASFADTLLIDLATSVDPDIEVVFCDTGFHFAETLATVRRAQVRYGLNLVVLRPETECADVWADGPDACCALRKVEPLDRHLRAHHQAWMSGLRRQDSPQRAATPVVELDRRGLVKVNPIATWSDRQVEEYLLGHDVLVNPLVAEGYPSIGCWPCTEPARPDDPRAGRWAGFAKTECGLHG